MKTVLVYAVVRNIHVMCVLNSEEHQQSMIVFCCITMY